MSTPTIFANLENLANDCAVSVRTLRKYRHEIEKAGLFRFETPPYWKRKTGFATEIHFPTKMVEKWLRDNGFLTTTGKNFQWSNQGKVNKTGVSPPAKLPKSTSTTGKNFHTFHKDEVAHGAATRATLGASAAAPVGRGSRGAVSGHSRQGETTHEPMASAGLTEAIAMACKKNGYPPPADQAIYEKAKAMAKDGKLRAHTCHQGTFDWFDATPDGDPIAFGMDPRCGVGARVTINTNGEYPGTIWGYSRTRGFNRVLVCVDHLKSLTNPFHWIDAASIKPSLADAPIDGSSEANAKKEEKLGGPLEGDDWFPATTVRPGNVPPDFVIDAIVGVTIEGCELDWDADWSWSEGILPRGRIIGYSETRDTNGFVLVDWQGGVNGIWWTPAKYLVVGGVTASDDDEVEVIQPADTPPIAPIDQSTTSLPSKKEPGAPAYQYCGGEQVRHLKFGNGTTLRLNEDGSVQCEFGEVHGVKKVMPAFLELVEPAPAFVHPLDRDHGLCVGAKARHKSRGVGLITHLDGDVATVAFESGEQTVLLSTLEPAA